MFEALENRLLMSVTAPVVNLGPAADTGPMYSVNGESVQWAPSTWDNCTSKDNSSTELWRLQVLECVTGSTSEVYATQNSVLDPDTDYLIGSRLYDGQELETRSHTFDATACQLAEGTWRIYAISVLGQEQSQPSSPITIVIDKTAPTATPAVPDLTLTDTGYSSSDNITANNSIRLDLDDEWSASNPLGFWWYQCLDNNGNARANSSQSGKLVSTYVSTDYATFIEADGSFNYKIRAWDKAGNPASSDGSYMQQGVTVDTQAPLPATSLNLAAGITAQLDALGVYHTTASVLELVTAPAQSGNDRYTYWCGETLLADYHTNTLIDPAGTRSDGTYVFSVTAKDLAGNANPTPVSLTVRVDRQAPIISDWSVTTAGSSDHDANKWVVAFNALNPVAPVATFDCAEDIDVQNVRVYQYNSIDPQQGRTLISAAVQSNQGEVTVTLPESHGYYAVEIADLVGNFVAKEIVVLTRGDGNFDGYVDVADYAIQGDHDGMTLGQTWLAGSWQEGDYNNDGSVTSADYTLMADNWTVARPDPVVDWDLTYTQVSLGGGWIGYTFQIDNSPYHALGAHLTFTADAGVSINQIKWVIQAVNDEATADQAEASDPNYVKSLDTWVCSDFGIIYNDIVQNSDSFHLQALSVGKPDGAKDMVYIVANGDISWDGLISREYTSYHTSGTTA